MPKYTLDLTEAEAQELRSLVGPGKLRKRSRRPVENADYVKFAQRGIRGLARRAAADVDTLPELVQMRDELDEAVRLSVLACKDEGYSWAEIAQRLGVTRQTAHERYGKPRRSGRGAALSEVRSTFRGNGWSGAG